jgi:hypothetical protein
MAQYGLGLAEQKALTEHDRNAIAGFTGTVAEAKHVVIYVCASTGLVSLKSDDAGSRNGGRPGIAQ